MDTTAPAPRALSDQTTAAPRPSGTGAAIVAVGASLPETVVMNEPIASRLGVSEDWIERRTGIRARRVAAPEETLAQHATAAGRAALDRAHVHPRDVDLVVVATTTADDIMPNAAPVVAGALGAVRAGAFDVGAACTGFLSALAVGSAQIESGRMQSVLVIGADLMTRITDPYDRATAGVFADGAGAVLLTATDGDSRIGPVVLGADGDGADLIVVDRAQQRIRMQGQDTFRQAVARLSQSTLAAAEAAALSLGEIDLFVYHQANGRILSAVGERLGLDHARVVDCIGEYGNTSAATLPLALAFSVQRGMLAPGDHVLLGAFGGGLTWGAVIAQWGEA